MKPIVTLDQYKEIISECDHQELHIETKGFLNGGINEYNQEYAFVLYNRLCICGSWLSALLGEELQKWKENLSTRQE